MKRPTLADDECIIPDCQEPAHNNFGVRLRTPETTAIWAPNTNAMVCDWHAHQGMQVVVQLIPTYDGTIDTIVHGQVRNKPPIERSTPIN